MAASDHVSRDRSPSSRLYDFGESSRKIRSALLQLVLIDGRRHQLPARQPAIEVAGVDPKVRRIERRIDRLGSAEDPDLALFAVRRRTKRHVAAADEDERGRALIGLGDEHRAFSQRELEVFVVEVEIPRDELLGWVQRQSVEVLDRAEPLLIGDPPGVSVPAPGPPDLEPPGGDARARRRIPGTRRRRRCSRRRRACRPAARGRAPG